MQFKQVASHVNLMPARYLGGNLSHFKNATLAARKKVFFLTLLILECLSISLQFIQPLTYLSC